MKRFLLLLFLVNTAIANGQDITGTWKWKNEKYQGIARFDSTKFHNEIYFTNTGTKVLEQFFFYQVQKNKIYLSDKPWEQDPDKKGKTVYKIKDFDGKKMQLSGISEDQYTLVSKEAPKVYEKQPGNFYLVSGKYTCFTEEGPSEAGSCLKFGEIDFSLSFEQILEKLGKPQNTIYNEDHSQTYLYLIYPAEKQSPVLHITMKDNKIKCLELEGSKCNDDFAFTSIRLGDFDSFVKQQLGEPYTKTEVTAPGDETWLYAQVPVTIRFRLHKISSIKIEPL